MEVPYMVSFTLVSKNGNKKIKTDFWSDEIENHNDSLMIQFTIDPISNDKKEYTKLILKAGRLFGSYHEEHLEDAFDPDRLLLDEITDVIDDATGSSREDWKSRFCV
jgi:hypothetical protein